MTRICTSFRVRRASGVAARRIFRFTIEAMSWRLFFTRWWTSFSSTFFSCTMFSSSASSRISRLARSVQASSISASSCDRRPRGASVSIWREVENAAMLRRKWRMWRMTSALTAPIATTSPTISISTGKRIGDRRIQPSVGRGQLPRACTTPGMIGTTAKMRRSPDIVRPLNAYCRFVISEVRGRPTGSIWAALPRSPPADRTSPSALKVRTLRLASTVELPGMPKMRECGTETTTKPA